MTPRFDHSSLYHKKHSARFWMGWGLALLIASVLVLLASLPPVLDVGPRVLLHQGFSWACHQLPGRSFHIDGVQLAVCHRCYGIYWGLPIAVMGFLAFSRWDHHINPRAKFILVGGALPPSIDWMGGVLGLWANTPETRVVTGAVFGLVVGYFLARAFVAALVDSSDQQVKALP